jgi:predicted enzyme related to lactoylglutathione lyase
MTTTPKPLAKGISISSITVSNLEKAKYFFTELLGLEIQEYAEAFKWLEVGGSEQGARLGIGEEMTGNPHSEEMKAGSSAIVSIEVYDVEHAKQSLEKHNIEFIGEIIEIPGEVKLALFKDPDGNRFFLSEKL